ncbi:MAG: type II toxin-antitoxin system prevent-host-death family antitoxin [Planctomycetota bacterium]
MRQVTVTELKNRLSEFLRLVKKGQTIEILERSVPIARIQGLRTENADALLQRLVVDGVVTRAGREPDGRVLEQTPLTCRADPVQAAIDGRGDR